MPFCAAAEGDAASRSLEGEPERSAEAKGRVGHVSPPYARALLANVVVFEAQPVTGAVELRVDPAGVRDQLYEEEEQLGPGETEPRMIAPSGFNGICGGCHNAIDGSETGIAPGPDVLTGASTTSLASSAEAVDLYLEPAQRQDVPVVGE